MPGCAWTVCRTVISRRKTEHVFSLLYEKDAVEYIYQLVKKTKHERSRYNLSSNDVISELKLAAMVQEAMGIESNIAAFSDSNGRCVLSGRYFRAGIRGSRIRKSGEK